jgi:hypothetical protein
VLGNILCTILDERSRIVAVADRTFQASDLAGTGRREFLAQARAGEARLRDTDGTSLLMVREGDYRALAALRDWILAYLVLENALTRPAHQRVAADFGLLAWAAVFDDDDDLGELRRELGDALVRATAARDVDLVSRVVEDWQRTARALTDPVSRAVLTGEVRDEEFVEAGPPSVVAGEEEPAENGERTAGQAQ